MLQGLSSSKPQRSTRRLAFCPAKILLKPIDGYKVNQLVFASSYFFSFF
jgi:hypothetical protein